MNTNINCAVACVNGCVLGEQCPHKEHQAQAAKFIKDTSLDTMLEMAEAARLKKLTQPTKWVLPDDL